MKKIKIIICLMLISVLLGVSDVDASTRVNTRTDGNYLVPNDVIVTESNKNAILSTPAIDASEKIYDFAELFSASEEEQLYKSVKHFIDSTNIDYVIVTTSKNTKETSKDYSKDFYNYNDFRYDGIILLIDRDKKGIYMSTFGRAMELFSDTRMEPILKNVFSLTKEKKFYAAAKSFTTSISEIVKIGAIPKNDEIVKVESDGKVKVSKDVHILRIVLFSGVGSIIILGILILCSRNVIKATYANNYLNKEIAKVVDISVMNLGSKTLKAPLASGTKSKKNNSVKQEGIGFKD